MNSSRPSKKRPFADENDDAFPSAVSSSPAKRNRSALKEANMAISCEGLSAGLTGGLAVEGKMKKSVLGEKKALANFYSSTLKGSITNKGDEKNSRQFKVVESKKSPMIKKRPLGSASPSPQRVARKSTSLSRHTLHPRSSTSGASAAIHKAVSRARGLSSSHPLRYASSSDESDSGVPLAAATAAPQLEIPESWKFAIYEDSHAEAMQNLMEHSATVLDISDESENEKWGDDEISQKGKENVSPERMAELMAGAGRDRMPIDPKEAKVLKEKRAALGELEVEKFYPKEEEKEQPKKEVAKEKDASEFVIDFKNIPALEFSSTSGLNCEAGFQVWAETDDESDGETGVPLTPPKGLEKKVSIVQEDEVNESASECGEASDKEN